METKPSWKLRLKVFFSCILGFLFVSAGLLEVIGPFFPRQVIAEKGSFEWPNTFGQWCLSIVFVFFLGLPLLLFIFTIVFVGFLFLKMAFRSLLGRID